MRTVLWQYRFTDPAEKRATGAWWKRWERGPFAPALLRSPDGQVRAYEPRPE